MAHMRQSRPDYGFGFQVNVLTAFSVFAFLFGSGKKDPPYKVTSLIRNTPP